MDKNVMNVEVDIIGEQVSFMECAYGKACILPFNAKVASEIFNGTTLPCAADVQTTDASGIKHMCAKYMFEGTDSEGNKCHVFVENNGYFEPDRNPMPFSAYPVIMSDSPILGPYFASHRFRSEGHPREGGVLIKIFEVAV